MTTLQELYKAKSYLDLDIQAEEDIENELLIRDRNHTASPEEKQRLRAVQKRLRVYEARRQRLADRIRALELARTAEPKAA